METKEQGMADGVEFEEGDQLAKIRSVNAENENALISELVDVTPEELQRAISTLTAENEALKKDAERLDWLDDVNRRSNERNGTTYGWKFDINHNRAALTDHNLPALSIREAIDKAKES